MVSVLDLIINGIGIGWTYVLMAGLSLLPLPIICGAIILGPRCRIKRQQAREQQQQQQQQLAAAQVAA